MRLCSLRRQEDRTLYHHLLGKLTGCSCVYICVNVFVSVRANRATFSLSIMSLFIFMMNWLRAMPNRHDLLRLLHLSNQQSRNQRLLRLLPFKNKTNTHKKSISSWHLRSRNQQTFVIFDRNMTEMVGQSSKYFLRGTHLCSSACWVESRMVLIMKETRGCGWTRGLLSALRVWRKRLALKRQKQREDGEERGRQGERREYGARDGARDWEIVRGRARMEESGCA